jgi:signal peptidase I
VITYFSWDYDTWAPRFWRILNPIEDDEVFREETVMQQLSNSNTALRRSEMGRTARATSSARFRSGFADASSSSATNPRRSQ